MAISRDPTYDIIFDKLLSHVMSVDLQNIFALDKAGVPSLIYLMKTRLH